MLSHSDNEAVHFVVDLNQSGAFGRAHRRWRMSRSSKTWLKWNDPSRLDLLPGDRLQSGLKKLPDLFVAGGLLHDAVAFEQSACVGINNEDGMIAGVEQNRICGLGTYAIQAQQFIAQLRGWLREQSIERAAVSSCPERR